MTKNEKMLLMTKLKGIARKIDREENEEVQDALYKMAISIANIFDIDFFQIQLDYQAKKKEVF